VTPAGEHLFSGDPARESPLIPAATVILLRDIGAGLETLMLRKNRGQAFGGMWVFPGGRVEAGDGPDGAPEVEAARHAAEREALEETGLVLADADLVPFSHWVPPPETPKRFSTWFFVAALPEGAADVVVDGGEIGDQMWTTPAGALGRHAAGEVELAPPTWMTLRALADAGSVEQVLDEARDAAEVPHFATRVVMDGPTIVTVWAGDVAYTLDPPDLDIPGPRQRLRMVEGGWILEQDS
jgi:8-oxo-dGTP pyrophosphatase MutT (NUDIX family)